MRTATLRSMGALALAGSLALGLAACSDTTEDTPVVASVTASGYGGDIVPPFVAGANDAQNAADTVTEGGEN